LRNDGDVSYTFGRSAMTGLTEAFSTEMRASGTTGRVTRASLPGPLGYAAVAWRRHGGAPWHRRRIGPQRRPPPR